MRRSLDRSLIALACAGMLLVLVLVAVTPTDLPLAPFVLFPLTVAVYLGAGLLAWHGRPGSLMGPLILLSGAAVLLVGLGNSPLPVLATAGTLAATVPLATFIHLLLAFPTGRLRTRAARATTAMAYLTATLLQAPVLGESVQAAAGAIVFSATALLLIVRLRAASGAERRVLIPLFSYGLIATILLVTSAHLFPLLLGWQLDQVGTFQLVVFMALPVAFSLAVLRGGVARTGEVEELGEWLESGTTNQTGIASALARTLGDPSLTIWFWAPQLNAFVDTQGDQVADPHGDDQRGFEIVQLDGRRIGAISFDRALSSEPELMSTASRVVALALDRERLTALLHASRTDLQRSRERLVEVADTERRRIAQDLHDGLQSELVLLGIEAQQMAHAAADDTDFAERAVRLRRDIDRSAAGLRSLVHAVMPAPLIQRGLSAAAEDLVDRMPIPTELHLAVADGELSAAIESTAYFVVAEALTNAVKHSAANSIRVALERSGSTLCIEIRDDGVGGARAGIGAGLTGMAERIDVLGGAMRITSVPGEGTTIRAEVPSD
ncbi:MULTISPECIES: ATP-binding protein [unclassified Leucobacter]|uniref:sensor histidine kinase n=1 Tax=unclassified Leucobacter TaxID=2621730 RepID=UPI00165D3D90|nr:MULTISPECIES: ATP-binding protein [unclassified Leucobacter]MBC9926247.1 sensor histidine kinase [Leucobacter sp. cx-169]